MSDHILSKPDVNSTSARDSESRPAPRLLHLEGAWHIRRGCVAAASRGFQTEQPPNRRPWWRPAWGSQGIQRWLFSPRKGEALVSAHGLSLIELSVTPERAMAVRLDRLIAYEDSLTFNTRYVRRVPLSGAGARHTAYLSGAGRLVVAAVALLHEVQIEDQTTGCPPACEPDFDPDALIAWSAELKFRFVLHHLNWSTLLSPGGFRETRMVFSGPGAVWLDAGSGPAPFPPSRGRQS